MWLTQFLDVETHDRLNKQLTYLVHADKSGWDITQVLRLPGTVNHKYPNEPPVSLLWFEGREVKVQGSGARVVTGEGPLLRRVRVGRRGLPRYTRSRLRMLEAAGDRSKVLYRMQCELLGAGYSKDEIFTLLRESVWNKFDDKRLSEEIHRVAERVR
jgi:hypothetical protein